MMLIIIIKEVDIVTNKVEETYQESEKARKISAEAWKAWIKAKAYCEDARVTWNESRITYNQAYKIHRETLETRKSNPPSC